MVKVKITLMLVFLLMLQFCCSTNFPNSRTDAFSIYPSIVLKNNLQQPYDLAKLSVYLYHYSDVCIETQYGKYFSSTPLGLQPITLDTLLMCNDTILFHFTFKQDSLICLRIKNPEQANKYPLVILVVAVSRSSNKILYVEKSSSVIIRDTLIDFHACLLKAIEDIKEDSLIVNPWLLKEIKKQVEYSQ
ncbi:MAG: hypothetical protein KA168_00420 [Chitinophagales bacterium]|nr:hypothetical protein [Chitinophagales bacterium]